MKKLLFILFVFSGALAYAQQAGDSTYFTRQFIQGGTYTIKTRVGTVYTGVVKEETKDFVVIENKLTYTSIELRKSEIVRITKPGARDLNNELMGENPHAWNYLLLSSSFLYEENQISTCSHWLLLENIDYAFSSNWAIHLNTLAFYPVSVGAKCAYELSPDVYAGGGVFLLGDIAGSNQPSFVFGYGAQAKITKGNSNRNVTLCAGIVGVSSNFFYSSPSTNFVNLPFVSGAFCTRLSKTIALDVEGWYVPEMNVGLGGLGIKFLGDDNTCWGVGCFTALNSYDNSLRINLRAIPIPYFGVTKRFD